MFSIRKRLKSFTYAFKGLILFLKTEHNAWLHLAAAFLVICLGFALKISNYDWCLLSGSIGMVFITEAFNTAIEKLTDVVSPEHSEKAGMVKDIAAGAVLIASMVALVTGALIFIPRI